MESIYFFRKSNLIFSSFLILFVFSISNAQSININENGIENRPEIELQKHQQDPFFNSAKRARTFRINSNILGRNIQKGQKIKLELFKNKSFNSSVINKTTDINGVTTFTIKLDEFKFAYGYLSISTDTYSMHLNIPELNEEYSIKPYKALNQYYIFQLDNSKLDHLESCGNPKKNSKNDLNQEDLGLKLDQGTSSSIFTTAECNNIEDSVTIDIMIVYTAAARDWSDLNEGGIQNTIANSLAICNNVASNSNLGITFNLVYSGLVDYVEDGSDLYYLSTDGEGKMDEIHDLRKNVGADLVTLFSDLKGALGISDLLTNRYGDSSSAFSVVRIGAATYRTTFIHELGHSLGASHSKYQNSQPGPTNWQNWEENNWSAGWRWVSSDNQMYTSVMSYPYGSYYDDNINSIGIPYFSDPDNIYLDAPAGNPTEGDNTRTINETKYAVSDYSESITYCDAFEIERGTAYISNVTMGTMANASGMGIYSDFNQISTCIAPQQEIVLNVSTVDYRSSTILEVWVDWNNDRTFDSSEKVFESEKYMDSYETSIIAPLGIVPGKKRMRIRLIDLESSKSIESCGTSQYGEVEDYTLNLYEPVACAGSIIPKNVSLDKIQSESVTISWDVIEGIDSYELQFKESTEANWVSITNIVYPFYELKGLIPSTEYQFRIRSKCGTEVSGYSSIDSFITKAPLAELQFDQIPVNASALKKLPPISLKILDINGGQSNSNNKVALSLIGNNSTEGKLTGEDILTAEEGSVVFDNLSINLPGTYSLLAKVEGLPEKISSEFIISEYIEEVYLVNTTADTEDSDLLDDICSDVNGNCSLRAAIQNSNKAKGKDKVYFNIAGTGPQRIILNSTLPAIVEPIILDATTQPGYTYENSQIIVDGNGLSGNSEEEGFYAFGLMGNSSGSEIKGFTIGGFDAGLYSLAFHLRNTGNHIITGNKIGVSADGMTKFPNFDGIYLESSHRNTIGGYLPEQRNIISGNVRGLTLDDSNDNNIIGNYIGLNVSGTDTIQNNFGIYGGVDQRKRVGSYLAFSNNNKISGNVISGNKDIGVLIVGENDFLSSNLIGTDASGENILGNLHGIYLAAGKSHQIGAQNKPNIISGNQYGIRVGSSGLNHISYNLIGTNITGERELPNDFGVYIRNSNVNLSGGQTIENNIISGNKESGLYLESSYNFVKGNLIGTNISGNKAIPNKNGIYLYNCEKNAIGGPSSSESNLISGNLQYGLWLDNAYSNTIFGNRIGTDISLDISLSNGLDGILVNGSENIIGSNESVSANIIANHPNSGISVVLGYPSTSNRISGNKIYNNGIGIDLDGNGINENDSRDSDRGPNNLQNYPEIMSASYDSSLQIEYRLDCDPVYSEFPIIIQLYKSDGNRQGEQYLGEFSISEKNIPKGKKPLSAEILLIPGTQMDSGDIIVATATDNVGNTSEFSSEIAVSVTGSCIPETWYADTDGDGFGDPLSTKDSCTQPVGYVKDNTDCDDTMASVHPGAVDDTVDGIDQNCDGHDGPFTTCQGSDTLLISEACSTSTNVYWDITNPGNCEVTGRWELRKSSSTGASNGEFSLSGGETIQVISGVVSKGKTQIVVYWNDSNGLEVSTSQNASGVNCASGMALASDSADLYVSPNPVDSGIGMYFMAPLRDTSFLAVVYNSSGQQMASESFSIMAGTSNLMWNIDHSSWIEGVYILNVTIDNQTYQTQFIK